jgi:hypothetical protein
MSTTQPTSTPPAPSRAGRRHRRRFKELPENERDLIRRSLAVYDKVPSFGYGPEGELYAGRRLADLLLVVLRHVQTLDGAPARCRKKECQKGSCHMFIDRDGAGVCPGGIGMAAVDKSGVILGGVMAILKHYCPAWFDYAAEKDAEAELEERAEMAAMEGSEEA